MIAIVPQTWHRVHSADGVTVMTATPLPGGDHIDLDIDDPRTVERKPGCRLGPRGYSFSRPQCVPCCYGPVTRNLPSEVLSIGFEGSVSISSAIQTTGL